MNESIHINTKHCGTCGLCCKSLNLIISKPFDKAKMSEIERLKLLDTELIVVHQEENGFRIEIKIPCKNFKESSRGSYCDNYARNIPASCREYPYENTKDCPHKKMKDN